MCLPEEIDSLFPVWTESLFLETGPGFDKPPIIATDTVPSMENLLLLLTAPSSHLAVTRL